MTNFKKFQRLSESLTPDQIYNFYTWGFIDSYKDSAAGIDTDQEKDIAYQYKKWLKIVREELLADGISAVIRETRYVRSKIYLFTNDTNYPERMYRDWETC